MPFSYAILLYVSILFLGCSSSKETVTPKLPEVSINNVTKIEGTENTQFDFTITLNGAQNKPVQVNYRTADGTAFGGLDYKISTGEITFNPSETEKTISIEVIGDNIKEGNEFFRVILFNPVNAELKQSFGRGIISNDDEQVPMPEAGYQTPNSYPTMNLVWADEFNGDALNLQDWTYEVGRGSNGWGNNELQYYTAGENAKIADGFLTLEARKDAQHNYTSTRMKTQDKRTFTYGRVDIRAKTPKGQGIWPALWMLGNNIPTANWPACGEIDIMEIVGHEPQKTHGTAHWGSDFSQHKFKGNSYALQKEDFSDRFHVFSIYWELNAIYWYVDDVLFYTLTSNDMEGQPYPFNAPFFFLFNIAVGGNWPKNPIVPPF
ncbi:MAG: family 16 glycosylhydrolase, partial [Saprospiraceae bacterium]|nr:family 16 glycosylhydrolase [Saprospiraceae bacterium]